MSPTHRKKAVEVELIQLGRLLAQQKKNEEFKQE